MRGGGGFYVRGNREEAIGEVCNLCLIPTRGHGARSFGGKVNGVPAGGPSRLTSSYAGHDHPRRGVKRLKCWLEGVCAARSGGRQPQKKELETGLPGFTNRTKCRTGRERQAFLFCFRKKITGRDE